MDRKKITTRMFIKLTAIHLVYSRCGGISKEKTGSRNGNRKNEDLYTGIRKRCGNDGGIRKENGKDAESIKKISRRKRTATKYNKIKDDGMQQERQTKTLKKWKNSII